MIKSKRIKILISIDWFLPGTNSGGPVRSYANLIEHLKDDFEFFIITRNTDFGTQVAYEGVTPNTWTTFNDYTQIYYISDSQLNKSHFKKIFDSVSFDIAYINGIYSWYFSILPVILLKKQNKPVLVSARGMLNPQAFSVKGFKKRFFLALASLFSLYKRVCFHATNEDESQHIKSILGNNTKVKVAPNLPRKALTQTQAKIARQHPVRFVNVARISIEKGTLVMLQSLQSLKHSIQLDLYGPIYDTEYWEKCEQVIQRLPDHIKVNYKGILSSDTIPEILKEYDYFILLSEGENFGHAIIEALFAGLPVLISNKTPWKNLKSKMIGWDVDITNQNIIIECLNVAVEMPQDQYLKWSTAAYQYALKFIENPVLIKQNKDLFLKSLNTV
jgi:glycosyltransferase involved in cell wall biosynthesis